jgi:hypothetical protein
MLGAVFLLEIAVLITHFVTGRFDDYEKVRAAFQGIWGAWVNTDGFTVGEEREVYAGMRIFEIARQTPTLKHYVYSSLDYMFKKSGYKDQYRSGHYDGKARVAEWLKAQPSDPNGLIWSVVTTGPYMDMLHFVSLTPLRSMQLVANLPIRACLVLVASVRTAPASSSRPRDRATSP